MRNGAFMKYDFTSHIDRHDKDAVAIDSIGGVVWGIEPKAAEDGFDEIPMWVADMNFATCPAITSAIANRILHPLFGYFVPTDAYYNAIVRWQTERNGYENLTKDEIGYENGVHGGICSVLNLLTQPGDTILMHSPAYVGFIGDLKQLGRYPSYSPLVKDEQGVWRMDYEDMEKRLAEQDIHMAIFCSPHNPTGRVWERWELEKAMALFAKYDVTVISDEIWSDIIFEGHTHIPTQMVSEDAAQRTISFYAPSKTFNLAGLIGSYHIIRNKNLRDQICKYEASLHYNEINVLSMHALIGAYSEEGSEWTAELRQVLEDNCTYAADFINEQLPGCRVSKPEGTYMLFMDVSDYAESSGKSLDEILEDGWRVGVAYQDGRQFHGKMSIRLNCALPKDRLEEAMRRLKEYVFV